MKSIPAYLPSGAVAFVTGSLLYLLMMNFLTGLRPEHLFIVLFINLLFFATSGTRKFILGFVIYAVFGMLYDLMRAFPNYNFNPVDIAGIYHFEKSIFGIKYHGELLTPNEFFNATHSVAADIISAFFYINWIPVPLAFAVFLFYSNRRMFLHYSLTFLFVNLIGFVGYYLHPAAPPWYVELHGFSMQSGIPGNTAGFSRIDGLLHLGLFDSIYSKNANVFAAVPSLHCAYPVIALYYASKARPRWLVIPIAIFMSGIWFAAVYSGHHYVIDVILGVICAILGIFLYMKVLMKTEWYRRVFERYLSALL